VRVGGGSGSGALEFGHGLENGRKEVDAAGRWGRVPVRNWGYRVCGGVRGVVPATWRRACAFSSGGLLCSFASSKRGDHVGPC